jgi:hypothetical protein
MHRTVISQRIGRINMRLLPAYRVRRHASNRIYLSLAATAVSLALLVFAPRMARGAAESQQQQGGWQSSTSGRADISVQDWSTPQGGWLYVLDPLPIPHSLSGRIWLLDPETGKVMGTIITGNNPDFALSPDGALLYVTSEREPSQSNVAIIDTGSGKVLATTVVENRSAASNLPPYSSMAVSADEATLGILQVGGDDQKPSFGLALFDARNGKVLASGPAMGNCGYGRFIDFPSAGHFDVLCPRTNKIWRMHLGTPVRTSSADFVVFPWERKLGVAEAFLAPGSKDMTILRGDGAIYSMDVQNATFSGAKVKGEELGRILPGEWPTSPDGKRVYVGYSRAPDTHFYVDFGKNPWDSPRTQSLNEIRVYDTGNWQKIGSIKTHAPAWTAVSASDGKLLYAPSPASHSVLVLGTGSMREIRAIPVGARRVSP